MSSAVSSQLDVLKAANNEAGMDKSVFVSQKISRSTRITNNSIFESSKVTTKL